MKWDELLGIGLLWRKQGRMKVELMNLKGGGSGCFDQILVGPLDRIE